MSINAMDLFAQACGATGPLIFDLKEEGRVGSTRRSFAQPFLVVGRHQDADLSLVHGPSGRRLAYLQMIGGRLYCIDLDSRPGALVGGAPLRSRWIDRGRAIRIGPLSLRLHGGVQGSNDGSAPADQASPLSSEYARQHRLPGAIIEFRAEEGKNLLWRVDPVLSLIGRSPACTVKLVHSAVSTFHCSLVRTPRGVWVVDLLSREGVVVNGNSRRAVLLSDGDEFALGPFAARIRYDLPAELPSVLERAPRVNGSAARTAIAGLPLPAEWMSTTPCLVPPLEGGELGALAVAPLLRQVSVMQEQMFDQFKQIIGVMAQTFTSMHRDQMEIVRQELEEIRRLTEEMRALRAAPKPLPPADTSERPRPAFTPSPYDAPAIPEGPLNGFAGGSWGHRAPAHQPESPLDESGLPADSDDRPFSKDPNEVAAFVSERLAAYERERQSCWNKIVRVVTSLRSDG